MLWQALAVANLGSFYPDDDQAVRWVGQTFGWDCCRRLGVHCDQQASAVSEMPSRRSCQFEIVGNLTIKPTACCGIVSPVTCLVNVGLSITLTPPDGPHILIS